MTTENETQAETQAPARSLAGESEEAKTRRRAVSTLLSISQRMIWLVTSNHDRAKILAELGGMSAWVSAFTCQLAGIPIELAPAPAGEFLLASLEVTPRSATDSVFESRSELLGDGHRVQQTDATSREAALAMGLVRLAEAVLRAGLDQATADARYEPNVMAEANLALALGKAVSGYESYLEQFRHIPEISAHGMPEDG